MPTTTTNRTVRVTAALGLLAALSLVFSLLWPGPRVSAQTGTPVSIAGRANCLLGQIDFTFKAVNAGGAPSARGMNLPLGVAIDPRNGRLNAVALLGVVIWWGDTLTLFLGLVLAGVLWYKRAQPLYLIMGLLVRFAETTGAQLGCWAWNRTPLDLLHATNPPVGAIVFYVLGDILTMRMARVFQQPRGR
ncbi:MAG TPA: hypothetical protein VFU22_13180 [Roseiflexaceae bacterium]|nr:hypothetical protein [Roseiflexaceae bacterium]